MIEEALHHTTLQRNTETWCTNCDLFLTLLQCVGALLYVLMGSSYLQVIR
jgi:hypothetical protein